MREIDVDHPVALWCTLCVGNTVCEVICICTFVAMVYDALKYPIERKREERIIFFSSSLMVHGNLVGMVTKMENTEV